MMRAPLQLHEDTFYKFFKPARHPKAMFDIWGGHGLTTFGSDYDLVKGFDEAYIWTVVDGSASDEECITSGRHLVNRVCYLVTKVSHENIHIDVICNKQHKGLARADLTAQIFLISQALKKADR